MSTRQEGLKIQVKLMHDFFVNSTKILTEDDSNHAPHPNMFTVAQQVAHTAQTIDWFLDGAFSDKGFDLNWDAHMEKVRNVNSLEAARQWLQESVDRTLQCIDEQPESSFMEQIAEGPIMAGVPRVAVFNAMSDHTAHHRGALTVYARQLNKIPPMPYSD